MKDIRSLGKFEVTSDSDRLILRRSRRDLRVLLVVMLILQVLGLGLPLLFLGLVLYDRGNLHHDALVMIPLYGGQFFLGAVIMTWFYWRQARAWVFDRRHRVLRRGRRVVAPLSDVQRIVVREEVLSGKSFWPVYLVLADRQPVRINDSGVQIAWRDEAEDLADELGMYLGVGVGVGRDLEEEMRRTRLKASLRDALASGASGRIEIREQRRSGRSFWDLFLVVDEAQVIPITPERPLAWLDDAEELADELGSALGVRVLLRRDDHLDRP